MILLPTVLDIHALWLLLPLHVLTARQYPDDFEVGKSVLEPFIRERNENNRHNLQERRGQPTKVSENRSNAQSFFSFAGSTL